MNMLHQFLAQAGAEQTKAPPAVAEALSKAKAEAPRTIVVEPNQLQAFFTEAMGQKNPAAYAEVRRLVDMPVRFGHSEEARAEFQREVVMAHEYDKGFRLHDLQCDATLAYREHHTLFAPIGVGWGKTLITLLVAAEAFAEGLDRTLLLVPPQVMAQLVKRDIPWARGKVNLRGCPFIPVVGSAKKRSILANSKKLGCYILPTSMLSTPSAEDLLEAINPKLIIGDEAHHLRNVRSSAKAKRIMRLIKATNPRVVWLSGTITAKSVMDYLHLVTPMGELSPLPLKYPTAAAWAAVLDADADPHERNTGPIRPLLDWAMTKGGLKHLPSNGTGFRRAYSQRLLSNPAVVATGDKVLGVGLTLSHTFVSPSDGVEPGESLSVLQDQVALEWLSPSGDEISLAFHKYRWHYELSAGIYNDLYWPEAEDLAKRRKISEPEAEKLLDAAKEHHEYRQEYNKELRKWLQAHPRRGMDTPMLVGQDMHTHGAKNVGPDLFQAWREVKDREVATAHMPERLSRVVRVNDYKIKAAVKWAAQHKQGIIWYMNQGVGKWLQEVLPDALFCPAGPKHNETIIDPETVDRVVIASISAHGTGKNLQFHENQLFVQWPRPAGTSEQTLGRLHRMGQLADDLTVDILATSKNMPEQEETFDELLYAAMLNDALYIQQTTGTRQKVIYGNYDPTPRMFPANVLEERGFELKVEADLSNLNEWDSSSV
ncbi:MAG: DEAD/DEAH box helicase [Rhodobacteraceae bacterium]|nr:DEAD/DEAH box helicase [Paracoccaceae bacterium]